MKQPEYILEIGTKIRTHAKLGDTAGMLVPQSVLAQRKADAVGAICGAVAGHGGDVYGVLHDDDTTISVYCFDEFELDTA